MGQLGNKEEETFTEGAIELSLHFQGDKRTQFVEPDEVLSNSFFTAVLEKIYGLSYSPSTHRLFFLDFTTRKYEPLTLPEEVTEGQGEEGEGETSTRGKKVSEFPNFVYVTKFAKKADCIVQEKEYLIKQPDISHHWIELRFTRSDIMKMTPQEFRFSSSEKLEVPTQLVDDVLSYIMITQQYDLLEEMFEVKSLDVQIYLLTYKPEIYEKVVLGYKQRHNSVFFTDALLRDYAKKPRFATFVSLLFQREWSEEFFSDIISIFTFAPQPPPAVEQNYRPKNQLEMMLLSRDFAGDRREFLFGTDTQIALRNLITKYQRSNFTLYRTVLMNIDAFAQLLQNGIPEKETVQPPTPPAIIQKVPRHLKPLVFGSEQLNITHVRDFVTKFVLSAADYIKLVDVWQRFYNNGVIRRKRRRYKLVERDPPRPPQNRAPIPQFGNMDQLMQYLAQGNQHAPPAGTGQGQGQGQGQNNLGDLFRNIPLPDTIPQSQGGFTFDDQFQFDSLDFNLGARPGQQQQQQSGRDAFWSTSRNGGAPPQQQQEQEEEDESDETPMFDFSNPDNDQGMGLLAELGKEFSSLTESSPFVDPEQQPKEEEEAGEGQQQQDQMESEEQQQQPESGEQGEEEQTEEEGEGEEEEDEFEEIELEILEELFALNHFENTRHHLKVLKHVCENTVIPQFYLRQIINFIDSHLERGKKFLKIALCKNKHVSSEELYDQLFGDMECIQEICKRENLSRGLLNRIFMYATDIERYSYEDVDSLFTNVVSNEKAELQLDDFRAITRFIMRLYYEDNNNFCECTTKLAERKDVPKEILESLLNLDFFSRCLIAARKDLHLDLRKTLMRDQNQMVTQLAMAYHPDKKVQVELLTLCKANLNDRDNLEAMSNLTKSEDLHDDVITEMVLLKCEKDWRFKREIALRPDVSVEQLEMVLNILDVDVFVNVSRNKSVKMPMEMIKKLGNFATTYQYKDFEPSFILERGREVSQYTKLQQSNLLYSYQSEIRMNLLQNQKQGITNEILIGWCDDPDFGVCSAIIQNIDNLPDRVIKSILDRRANSEVIREDLVKMLITKFIDAGKKLYKSMIVYSRSVSVFILDSMRKMNMQYPYLFKVLKHIISAHKRKGSVMKIVSEILLLLPNERRIQNFSEIYASFCLNFNVNIDFIFPLIHMITDQKVFNAILKRNDLKEDHLIKLILREIHVHGYCGEILKKIAERERLPPNITFFLCFLQSKLGKYNVHSLMELESGVEMIKNDLFPIFLRKNTPLNEHILKYYFTFEPDMLVPMIKSGILDSAIVKFFFDKILAAMPVNDKHPVRVYVKQFMDAIRQLSGEPTIQIYDLNMSKLTSKLIRDTISFATNGVKFGRLWSFLFENLGLNAEFSNKTIDLFNAFEIVFKEFLSDSDDLAEVPTVPVEGPTPPKNVAGDEYDFSPSSSTGAKSNTTTNTLQSQQRRQQFNVRTITFTSFEEMKRGLVDILLSSNKYTYLVKFFEKGYMQYKFERTEDSFKFVLIPKEKAELYNSTFEERFNERLVHYVSSIFTSKVFEKEFIGKEEFLTLLDPENHTIEKVVEMLEKFNIANECERELKILKTLLEAGIKTDIIQNMNLFLGNIEKMMEGEQGQLFEKLKSPVLVRKLPYKYIYEISRLIPKSMGVLLDEKMRNLLSIYGKPEVSESEKTVSYFYSALKDILDLFSIPNEQGDLFIDSICSIQNMHFLGSSLSCVITTEEGEEHRCSCAKLERKLWKIIVEKKIPEFIADLKGIFTWFGSRIKRYKIVKKAENTLRSHGVFDREKLTKIVNILKNKSELLKSIKSHVSLGTRSNSFENFLLFISPFASFVDVQFFMYRLGPTTHERMIQRPACMFEIEKFFMEDITEKGLDFTRNFLKLMECVEFISKYERRILVDQNVTISQCEEQLKGKDWEKDDSLGTYLFIDRTEVSSTCSQKIRAIYREVINKFLLEKKYLNERVVLTLLTKPSETESIEIVSYEAVQSGKRSLQHPLKLDENAFPMVDPQNERRFLRDTTQPKRYLPMIFPRKTVKQTPKLVKVNQKVNLEDVSEYSGLQLIDMRMIGESLKRCLDEEFVRISKMVFTEINKERLNEMIEKIRSMLETGIHSKVPSNKKEFHLCPREDYYRPKIIELENVQLQDDPKRVILDFQFHKTVSLPAEMLNLINLIESVRHSDIKINPDELDSKIFQVGFALEVLNSEPNYHEVLDSRNAKLLNVLSYQLNKLFPQIMKYQSLTKGCILVCFRVTDDGGYAFISSQYDSLANRYDNYLHFNNNACANLDYGRAIEMAIERLPFQVLHGMRIEDCIFTSFGETVVMSFTKERMQIILQTTDKELRQVVRANDFRQEVAGAGAGRSAGAINYYSQRLNHFQKEACLCNASPILPFSYDAQRGKIYLKKKLDEMKKELKRLADIWGARK